MSGGFTASKAENLQSEGIQSGDDDYLMNETRRKPTTGTLCPTLFDKWLVWFIRV